MTALHDIALMVEERGTNQFHWILLQAVSSDEAEAIQYRRIYSARVPQTSYSNALVVGANALRKLGQVGTVSDTML
ncbi:MAG: hypothetical protein J7605_02960 [Variovorax sp.]|nr:hypothetical protein [Variovorax sp.]